MSYRKDLQLCILFRYLVQSYMQVKHYLRVFHGAVREKSSHRVSCPQSSTRSFSLNRVTVRIQTDRDVLPNPTARTHYIHLFFPIRKKCFWRHPMYVGWVGKEGNGGMCAAGRKIGVVVISVWGCVGGASFSSRFTK